MKEDLKLKFLHIFFPNKCPSCHKIIYYNDLFCNDCFKELVLPKGERCKVCFSLKEKCDCNKNPKFYLGLDIDVDQYKDLLSKKRNNVVVTPHIAGCTDDAIKRQYTECAENIVNVLKRRKEEKDIEVR